MIKCCTYDWFNVGPRYGLLLV